jgi:hypothetical protein
METLKTSFVEWDYNSFILQIAQKVVQAAI